VLAVSALLLASAPAHAFDDSTRGPFYVQANAGSFSFWPAYFGDQAFWHTEIEFGFHITGRHDGLALGIRQGFDVGRDVYSIGETMLRGGWDFALPFRNGRFELTVAPYGVVGIDYIFRNLQAGVHFAVGLDARLFFFRGLYLLIRPIELGFGDFVPLPNQNVYFTMNMGLGLGYAF
jgi:hypothetical protein